MGPDSMSEYERELVSVLRTMSSSINMITYDIAQIKSVLGDTSMGLNEIAVQLRTQNKLWEQFFLGSKE